MHQSHAALSCMKCRLRKVKCDKTLPACKRCEASQEACTYRSRQPREKKIEKTGSRSSKRETQDTLALIWTRLRRIEENAERNESLPSASNTPPTADPSPLANVPSFATGESASQSPATLGARSQHGVSPSPISHVPLAPTLQLSLHDTWACNPEDIISELNKAVGETLALGRARSAKSKAYLLDHASIPRELARAWMNNFFHNNGTRFYPAIKDQALIDVKLLHLMPDLMQMEHVHVDASVLVIYFCMLWQGHFVIDKETGRLKQHDLGFSRNLYIGCLRAVSMWQREASGTATDFVAATFMVQVAAENLDFQLCWEMHKYACVCSEAMQLHSIDSDETSRQSLIATTDGGRMSMWNLVQMELFFRLISDKPPSFSFDLSQWRVNLPFLFFDEVDLEEAMPTTAFLAGSRVTLILIRFFQTLQDPGSQQNKLLSVLSLCEQVEEAVQEWDIFDWHQSYNKDCLDGWYLSELALSCYSSILFMLRKVAGQRNEQRGEMPPTSEQTSLCKETELRASRRIILIVCQMIQIIQLPGPQSLSLGLGMYSIQVAYGTVAAHLLDQPKAATVGDDLLQLKRFGSCINGVAAAASEFGPFAATLRSVEARLEAQVVQST